jgi:hypothetical protein
LENRRNIIAGFCIALAIGISFETCYAAKDAKSLIVKAYVGKAAKLVVDTNTITFPDAGADEVKQIPASQNDIKVTVKARTERGSPVTLNVMADGDLASGSDSIPIQNVTWQAAGQGFRGGTLSKTSPQAAGSWTGSGTREGVFRYYLLNSWNYQKGDYQVTLTYTLTVP